MRRRWHSVGIVACALALGSPLQAGRVAAQASTVVEVNSAIEVGFPALPGDDSWANAVDGTLVAGSAPVAAGVRHVFVADLATTPPTVRDLGTLGGSSANASGVSGPWVAGGSYVENGSYENHAYAVDVTAATPTMIDLHPAGMVYSSVFALDGLWAVGEADEPDAVDRWWGAAWYLGGATVATPPQLIKLAPLSTDPYAWADKVSGNWATGVSVWVDAEDWWHYTAVAWDLTGATADTPVTPVVLPQVPGGEADVDVESPFGVSGHWAVGRSTGSGVETPVVWDLDQAAPAAIALPTTVGTYGSALGVDGDRVVGYEYTQNPDPYAKYPVVWDLSTDPPTETVLPNLGSPDTEAGWAIAIDGDWVVGSSDKSAGYEHAFAYNLATDGPMLDLGALVDQSTALAVSGTWAIGSSSIPDESLNAATAWNLLAPAPPALGTPTAGDTTVSLTWTEPAYTAGAAITGYTLAYKATSDTDWTTVAPDPATTTSITLESLLNGTEYQFRVRASTANGDSAYSDVVTGTPVAPATVPGAPNAPTATNTKPGVSLTWTDTGDGGAAITDHQIKVYKYTKARKGTPATYTWVMDVTTGSSTTTYEVTGLNRGTTYAFTVAAGNSVGFSGFSGYSNAVKN